MKFKISRLLAAALLGGFATSASAVTIDLQLVVNVVTVCDNAGANCASNGPVGNAYFESETDKIWAQAGIDIKFVNAGTINNSTLLTGASGVGNFTGPLAGPGTTMYLVNDLLCPSCTLYGEAYLNAGGLVINMGDVMAFNGGIGRLDTIAHELGHNLGLGHFDSNANFLMASGSVRNVPNSLGQICPDGVCYSLLPSDQISTVRRSSLLIAYSVPEPGAFGLLALGLLSMGLVRRRLA